MLAAGTHGASVGASSGAKSAAPSVGRVDGMAVAKRLQSELMQLMMSGSKDVNAFPDGDNLFEWTGTLSGSKGTVYEGLVYKLKLKFPADYPFTAPTITFATPCFHPNVDQFGNICLDILKDKWSAAYSVHTILLSLQTLLGDPNNDSPLNAYAANLWADQDEYRKVCRKKYAEATGKDLATLPGAPAPTVAPAPTEAVSSDAGSGGGGGGGGGGGSSPVESD